MSDIRFPVEGAHVLAFARAVGDESPVYFDPDRARAAGLDGVIAPPTFGIAADHFDPAFERRPQPGVPWFGSGREPVSASGSSQQPTGGGSGFHAEEQFTYHRPLRVGDLLHGNRRRGASWHKTGRRGGRLSFVEEITDYRDAAGDPVLTLCWVNVLTERAVGLAEGPAPRGEASAPQGSNAQGSNGWEAEPTAGAVLLRDKPVASGHVHEEMLVEDLKRTQIVMYAGASGDFHPMHTDEPYARAMGMPGVFAHGMLTMGMTGAALTRFAGDGVLADYSARFASQVWPGDDLRARVTFESVVRREGRRAARLSVLTLNQRDEAVLAGRAHAWLDR